ncbi:MAG TPA: STAS domain-containing protein [Pilimelia sp.]|nr:STAS domain-containing protein [Pilimelia sp.]
MAGQGDVLDVALHGEIDYTNADLVGDRACHAIERDGPAVVRMDLAGVTFVDSSGIGVLVRVMKAARQAGAQYRVDGTTAPVYGQLQMTGLTDLFPVQEPPATAAASA